MYLQKFYYNGGSADGYRTIVSKHAAYSLNHNHLEGIELASLSFKRYSKSQVSSLQQFELVELKEYLRKSGNPINASTKLVREGKTLEYEGTAYAIVAPINKKTVELQIINNSIVITATNNGLIQQQIKLSENPGSFLWKELRRAGESLPKDKPELIVGDLYNFLRNLVVEGYFV